MSVLTSDLEIGPDRMGPTGDLLVLLNAGSISKAICVATELHIPDLLKNGVRTAPELARASGSHAESVQRLMRALVTTDICTEGEDGTFTLTPMGELLCEDHPNSLRSWTIWCGGHMWTLWGHLLQSVRTGDSVRKLVTGTEGFEHLDGDRERAATFNRAMAEFTRHIAAEVLRLYDIGQARRIVDVGGGYGILLAAILNATADSFGVLLDRAHAIPGAQAHFSALGLSERCELIAGDFFESVPGDGDLYLLKSVIHDWNDGPSITILRNCRGAISPAGRLLLIERVLPAHFRPCCQHRALARADLNMLVALGGKERSAAQFEQLLEAGGFRLARVLATRLEYSLLEAVPS